MTNGLCQPGLETVFQALKRSFLNGVHSDLRGSVRNWVSWRALVGSRHNTLCCQTETNYLQRCRDLGQGKSLELGFSEAILWPCAVLAINLWHLWFLVGNFHSRKAIGISILS